MGLFKELRNFKQ